MRWKGFKLPTGSRFIPETVLLRVTKSLLYEKATKYSHHDYLVWKIERIDSCIDWDMKWLDLHGDSDEQHNLRARVAYREAAKETTQRYLAELR